MKMTFIIATLLAVLPAALSAKTEFAQYEGKDSIREGQGGTKIIARGVEFWTTGTPPRRFQIIGILTDTRKDKLLSGHAMGSSAIAKKVQEAGADAVILLNQNSAYAGTTGSLNTFNSGEYGSAFVAGHDVHEITSRFLVIRYLAQ